MNETIETILKAKDISPTAMRILVLEFLQKQHSAVSLQDVEDGFAQADRTTIYRTLKTFEEKGLIHSIHDGTDSTKYALCAEACKAGDHYDLHLHFYCMKCRQTYCLPKQQVPDIDMPAGYELQELSLVAKGTCETCTANNAIQLHADRE